MPAKSQAQFRLMKAAENNPKFAKKVGIKPSVAKEYTESNVGKKAYAKLPTKMASGGLYDNINAKRVRIAAGSGEKMRKPGTAGAPTAQAFKESAKTVKKASGGGVSLAVGRGEKLPVSKGAGLTAKGRAKYNRETGSNLKAPQPEGGPRKRSFCARMSGMPGPMKDEKGRPTRKAASLARWKC
jgi:hypothetical protein